MKIPREDIHLLSRHSNWSETSIDQTLKEQVYADKKDWLKFIKLFCLSLGITLTTLGILFFFAYNWADLHKFIKIGLIQGIMIAATLVAVVPKIDWNIRRIILMGAAMMVGILFAVFGQVYQTGANAYDFFLGWTVFIALWVLVSNFAPLWLMFLTLINTTFILYTDQVATGWKEIDVMTALFVLNSFFVVVAIALTQSSFRAAIPHWFIRVVALAAIGFATMSVCIGIFDSVSWTWGMALVLTVVIYSLGIAYGLKTKDRFYLAAIPFSMIIIVSSLLAKVISEPTVMFFTICIFVVGTVTWLVKSLLHLQKKWSNE